MKIGITERGDAGLNIAWCSKLNEVDGAVLISKNFTNCFIKNVLKAHNEGHKIIVHCTCTGYGATELEPNVPEYKKQLNTLKNLIDSGFPAEQCVLRVDPIFPSEKGLNRLCNVLDYFMELNTGVNRIRISIVDEYKHVKERYRQKGWEPLYGDKFYASNEQMQMVANVLNAYSLKNTIGVYKFTYEVCAENYLATKISNVEVVGCISNKDLSILGLPQVDTSLNPQKRSGCHCLSCKTELLTERKPCPNGCIYCFWK